MSDLGQTQAPPRGPRQASAGKAIVDATLELLAERGQAATIEAIAERAGVGRNTIYRRWASKEQLIVDALQELVVDLDFEEDGDVYSLLLDWVRDFVRVFGDPFYGRILPVVLGELQQNPDFARVYSEQIVQPRYEALLEFLRAAVERGGSIRTQTPSRSWTSWLLRRSCVLSPSACRPSRSATQRLLETIWRGIAPPAPRP